MSLEEQELLILPMHLNSPLVFSGVHVTRSLVLWVCFVDRYLSFCTFYFGHCVVCSYSIYGFWIIFGIFKRFIYFIISVIKLAEHHHLTLKYLYRASKVSNDVYIFSWYQFWFWFDKILNLFWQWYFLCSFFYLLFQYFCRGRRGCDRLVVGFTTICAISAYHHLRCEFEPCSWRGVIDRTLCDKVCQWVATVVGFLHQ